MAVEQIPTNISSESVENDVNETSTIEKIKDSNDQSQEIAKLNKNKKLAKDMADEIVRWLPETINQLSVEQQKLFVELVSPLILEIDGLVDLLPNRLPTTWQDGLTDYLTVESNKSKLSPDMQKKFEDAKQKAISEMTEESTKVIDADK